MEEKTDNIDILEDYIELIEKGYCEDCNELCNISKTPVYPSKAVAQAISTLIAENKELKEENEGLKTKLDTLIEKYKELKEEKEELKRENLEIRDWKYVIDSPIDLDKLKELDLIKIKGKEYISKSIYNELEKDKKALINNYSKILGEFIPKSKVEGLIEELDIEIQCCTYADDDVEEYKQDIEKEKARLLRDKKMLQSLLGKE